MIHRFVDIEEIGSLPYVVFETQGPADNNLNVFRIFDNVPTRITPWTDSAGIDPPLSNGLANPRLSPNGLWVAFTEFGGGTSILYVGSATGTSSVAGLIEVFSDATEDELDYPSWHPDSDQLLFIHGPGATGAGEKEGSVKLAQRTNPGGTPTELWVPAKAGANQREGAFRPQFSPDGTMIAFFVNLQSTVDGDDPTRQGLWTMDADGSNDSLISAFYPGSGTQANRGYMFDGTQLDWSHDSEWIVFVKDGFAPGAGGVYKIRPDGTDETLLVAGTSVSFPALRNTIGLGAWSDDDSFIIYSQNQGISAGDWSIRRVNADGTGDTQLVSTTNGPAGTQDYSTCYRNPFTNRLEWISRVSGGRVSGAAIDGTDLVLNWHRIDLDVGSTFSGTAGHEHQ